MGKSPPEWYPSMAWESHEISWSFPSFTDFRPGSGVPKGLGRLRSRQGRWCYGGRGAGRLLGGHFPSEPRRVMYSHKQPKTIFVIFF